MKNTQTKPANRPAVQPINIDLMARVGFAAEAYTPAKMPANSMADEPTGQAEAIQKAPSASMVRVVRKVTRPAPRKSFPRVKRTRSADPKTALGACSEAALRTEACSSSVKRRNKVAPV